jgi:hypothetical protein
MLTLALMIMSSSVVKAIINNRAVIVSWDYRESSKLRLFVKVDFRVASFLFFVGIVLVGFTFNLVTSLLYFLTYFLILPSCTLSSLILS